MTWQPIETAPKWRDGDQYKAVRSVLFAINANSVAEAELFEDGWWWANARGAHWATVIDLSTITHWTPLPAPPEVTP